MNKKYVSGNIIMLFAAALIFVACGSKTSSQEESGSETETTDAEATEPLGAEAELSADQNVFFVNLEDGDTVTSPFTVEMGVNGMEVEPAGEPAINKGHHHIIINGDVIPKGEVVPTDSTHLHYGQGQISTELDLEPGEHTLRLQFADGFHRSYGEQMSVAVNVTVQE